MKAYTLTLTHTQARTLSTACEVLARLAALAVFEAENAK